MKSLKEFRHFPYKIQTLGSSIRYIVRKKIDFDVFLPSIGKNLQRPFVWDLFQKQEFIISILLERNINPISVIEKMDDSWEIIDGKQRLSSVFSYINNEFSICIEGEYYYFKELDKEYQLAITHNHFPYFVLYEQQVPFTDKDKISWFKRINFAGTPMDLEHLASLS